MKPTKPRDISQIPFPASTMETIDSAIYRFLNETLDINCMTSVGFKKVPVIWTSAERAYQSKNQKVRDKDGSLILPIVTVERSGVTKDPSRKGTVYANIPPMDQVKGGSISVSRKINQAKTSNFANSTTKRRRGQINFADKNDKVVYQTISIPLPVYVTVQYEITLRTEYQEQMNQIVTPFITRPGGINYIIIEEGRLRYEAFIQDDFSQSNNLSNFSNEERKFETKINIEVLGWLTGEDANRLQPNYAVRENAVEVKIPRERVAFRDDLDKSVGRLYGLAGIPVDGGMIPFRRAESQDPISNNGPVRMPGAPTGDSGVGSDTQGPRGQAGPQGAQGVGIQTVRMVNYELIVDLTDGTSVNVGNVRGATGPEGPTPDLDIISGTLATYHTFDGDKGVFNDLDVIGTAVFNGDVTVVGNLIGGSPLKVSQSLAIIDGDGDTVALFGSSSLGPSVFSASLITSDEIFVTNDIKFSGLADATAEVTKYLALDVNNNVVLTSSTPTRVDVTNLSGTIGTIHNLSSSTATVNLLDANRVETSDLTVSSITVSGDLNFSGLAAGTPISSKYLALDASNNLILASAAGEEANFTSISGSSLTYHNISGSSLTSNLLNSDRAEINDLSSSSGIVHNLSSSALTSNLVTTNRLDSNELSGSTATVHTISGSTGTFNLLSSDRIDSNEIEVQGHVRLTGLSNAAAVSTKYLALDSNNDIVLTSSSPVVNLFVTGSEAIYHNISGSTATLNLLDADRAEINDLSGSTGTIHNLSSSALTSNLVVANRIDSNQLSGSTATIHAVSASTGTYNLVDADRVEVGDLDASSITATGDLSFTGLSSGTPVDGKYLALDASNNVILASATAESANFTTISGSNLTYHNMSGSTLTLNLLDSDRAEISDLSGSTGTIHNLSSSVLTSNLVTANRVDSNQLSGSSAAIHTISGSTATLNLVSADRVKVNDLSGSAGTVHNLSSSAVTSNLVDADRIEARDLTNSGKVTLTGLSAGTGVSSKYLALDSNDNVVLTSSSGTGGGADGTIGAAEDGTYTDGLFTDFVSTTPIGTPIDRFNEVLKILAPSPAPDLRSIEHNISNGVAAKLSFGSSQEVPHYSSSATAAGFTAININETYEPGNNNRNLRLGVYDDTQDVTGIINDNVAASVTNTYVAYASGAYGNAETGILKLELNGNIIHSIDLSEFNGVGSPGSGTDSSLNAETSGFTNTSITASSFDGNNAEWYIFKHRTGRFKVDKDSMVPGWNYARLLHAIGDTNKVTNYIEWVVDPSGSQNNLAASNERIEDVTLIGSKYLSGVEYNTDATANYKVDIGNLYQNVYQASGTPISFTVSNSTTPAAQAVPAINTGGGENSTKTLSVVAALNVNVDSLLDGAITANVTATHPLKSTLSNAGSATTGNGFLIDNRTLSSTNLSEKFHDETYRKVSASYDAQADVTNVAKTWNSQTHMLPANAGFSDGLLMFNQRLYSPVDGDIPNGGNFSGMSNVEAGQPDYSSVTGTRTFFRAVQNTTGETKRDIKIETTKNGTTFNASLLGASNARLYVKIPGTTGWMDASQNFVFGRIDTDDGALISGASNDVDDGNNTHHLTFGSASVANNEYVMVKIEADESWAGYISQMDFTVGATSNTATPAPTLDDIDANDTGLNDAKLSFGVAHTIPNYSSVTGSGIGLTDFNTNGYYSVSGDRRGVFSSYTVIDGELNEDVVSSGNNYPTNAFNDALDGSLVLEVNGVEVHIVDISDTIEAKANEFNGNSSGFSVSSVNWSTTVDNIPDYTKPYRTGTYQIGTADQRLGWNYARVIHRKSGGDVNTNYVEWVVDTDSNALSSADVVFNNFYHSNVFKQSGVGYFSSRPTASFEYRASNVYKNVYQNGNAISFPTTTNCSISNIRVSGSGVTTKSVAASTTTLADLNNTGNCHAKDIEVSGTVLFDSLTSIVEEFDVHNAYNVTVSSRIIHPHKATLNVASVTKSNLMVYNGTLGSTNANTNEYFNREDYRIISGTYNNQADPPAGGNAWNANLSVNDNGNHPSHADGLVFVNGYLMSPKKVGAAGDTRNIDDGGTLQAPAGNPNYSTLTLDTRTFLRHFQNNTANDRSSITITLYGDGSLVKRATSLGANGNFYLDAKIPGKTAWLDVGTAYSSNNPNVDGAGALDGADPGNPAVSVGPGGTSVVCNFNGESLLGTGGGSEYVVLRITADEDWSGYLTRIQVAYS